MLNKTLLNCFRDLTVLVYLEIAASQGKTQIKCMDTQKFIHSVKLHILHQMKPYSKVKAN